VIIIVIIMCSWRDEPIWAAVSIPPPPALVLKLLSNPSANQKRQNFSHCLNITTYYCVIYENCDGRCSFVHFHAAVSMRQNKAVRCTYSRTLEIVLLCRCSLTSTAIVKLLITVSVVTVFTLAIFQTIKKCTSEPLINCKQVAYSFLPRVGLF
jgi:hypothetical protein